MIMTRKHIKLDTPTDADLYRNPMIGASKGMTMAGATSEDLEELEGENTIEGDVENDTNAQGGIDKPTRAHHRTSANREQASGGQKAQQGHKTHEQQLRMLERKPDVPDARHEQERLDHAGSEPSTRVLKHAEARQSEFPVSRAGMNQESQHNKHNHQTQAGHAPQTKR
jgi:hypothetical protein